MFTGIIQGVGTVAAREALGDGVRLTLRVPGPLQGLSDGTSLAVNGTCLTVVKADGEDLVFDAVGATLRCTRIGEFAPGDRVNLEPSLTLGGPVDGHLVTGHVDDMAEVTSLTEGEGAVYYEFEVSKELACQIAIRGSVAVDGVSLTVSGVHGRRFTVSIVPYTLEHTIFGDYRPGSRVHVETDVLAKYVQRLTSEGLTSEGLTSEGGLPSPAEATS